MKFRRRSTDSGKGEDIETKLTQGEVTRGTVSADGLSGVVCIPARSPSSAVVVLGGSDGGMKLEIAETLARQGIAAFACAYWPAAPAPLSAFPIERIEHACRWLLNQPEVIGERVGLLGQSKGAELALVVATQFPGLIGPVIAVAPSAVVWYGIDQTKRPPMLTESSWSYRGIPLPYVSMSQVMPTMSDRGVALRPSFEAGLDDLEAVGLAAIPVELATGPILLLSGGDDQMWPADRMGRMVVDRMSVNGRPADITHFNYEKAGHSLMVSAPTTAPDASAALGMNFDLGGSDKVNAAAREDAALRITAFFGAHLNRPIVQRLPGSIRRAF